ncbi:UV-B-induced protein At3g17800, chloroplastic isoform X2 [Ziziphus jujuba]|uniref:UV-B-induced protein At3g17800, chloroplastic isoform X2 n=1 Tax=Ziziphus jujuba TaxID=326968 RepID=A0A6P6GG30_ZIZJJ|nr:UV-B-induced protein At3g17800, chloroplastic isoform X2 [Ziziphus jujuba]XP_048336475.2 UV-B-induced protein At3g17800, chloroplastic isoform X2 [Ziziphus jujuba]
MFLCPKMFLIARRIAKLKENECQIAVEDVMYLLIFYKFSELKVHLVPKLSRCIYNGRLEIWPSKDWELESIHSDEALEMIREHVTTVIGLRANASVKEAWATTKITRSILGRVYVASILYGYFLKSASSRLNLEQCLAMESQELTHRNSLKFPEICSYGVKHLLFGRLSSTNSKSYGEGSSRLVNRPEKLRCYVMGFDPDTLQRCAKLKSKEAMNLIENHSRALFGDETSTGFLESEEVILTSFSSLKRLVLEAVAFGSFIWETEDCVNTVYKLKEG